MDSNLKTSDSYFTELIGNLAGVASIINYSTGIFVCKKYVTNKTTGDASALPFVSGILFSALWSIYGHARGCSKLVQVNLVGLFFMCGYSTVFYFYTLKRAVVVQQSAANALIFSLILYNVDENSFGDHIGLFSTIFATMTVAEPMLTILSAVNVKNTECFSVPSITIRLLVTSLWALYGYLINEFLLTVVNISGAAVALLQVYLLTIYSRSSTPLVPKHV